MKLVNRTVRLVAGHKEKRIALCGIVAWEEEKSLLRRRCKVLGIPLLHYRRNVPMLTNAEEFDRTAEYVECLRRGMDDGKESMLWVDHALGGGTEKYSRDQFSVLNIKYNIFRLQYLPQYALFKLNITNIDSSFVVKDFEMLKSIVSSFDFNEIVVNSIVSWCNVLDMLDFVSCYKNTHPHTKVSARGHDMHALCPQYNLINCDGVFCNLSYKQGCENCLRKVALNYNEMENKILFSGFKGMTKWRDVFGSFFGDTVDECIVFSDSTRNLFSKCYPVLEGKIKIVPHRVQLLDSVVVERHADVNIAILGNINSRAKGHDIIRAMQNNNRDPLVKLIVIGSYANPPEGLTVTGEYQIGNVSRIVRDRKIDAVFIPSIWPETFSYTTSEAISLDIPVVCYNLGAQAERVGKYAKGLVLKEINPQTNLQEIKKFVMKLRKDCK